MIGSQLFNAGNISLEGRLDLSKTKKGVVITHPHPLYGGNMDNAVVQSIAAAYKRLDFTTLTFNFRGTGKSQGAFDNGKGEAEDLTHALAFLSASGIRELHLSGYSFGSWVNAGVDATALNIRQMTMVSPPVAFMDFSHIKTINCPLAVIAGSRDDIGPSDQVSLLSRQWQPDVLITVIDGADHFYSGFLGHLEKKLAAVIEY